MIKKISPIILYNFIIYTPYYFIYTIKSDYNLIFFKIFSIYILSASLGSIVGYILKNKIFTDCGDNLLPCINVNKYSPFLVRFYIMLFLILGLLVTYNYLDNYYPAYYMMGGYGIFFTIFNLLFIFIFFPSFDSYDNIKIIFLSLLYIIIFLFILGRFTNSFTSIILIALYLIQRNNIKFNLKSYLKICMCIIIFGLIFSNFIATKLHSFFNQLQIVNIINLTDIYDHKLIFYKLFMPFSFFDNILANKNFYPTLLSTIINYGGNNPAFSVDPILELFLCLDNNFMIFFVVNFIILLAFNYLSCNLSSKKIFVFWILFICGGMVVIDFFYIYMYFLIYGRKPN